MNDSFSILYEARLGQCRIEELKSKLENRDHDIADIIRNIRQ